MRSAAVRLCHDHMLTKEPGTRQRTPWHQDQPYYNIQRSAELQWIPVDPVGRESTLEFVAGSHRGLWLMPRSYMDAQARWFRLVHRWSTRSSRCSGPEALEEPQANPCVMA
jgi:ectoine hydroxylase-related dioxygenase (phytanoyl-CoA dioxygenase family)